jgi:hypothetical protein
VKGKHLFPPRAFWLKPISVFGLLVLTTFINSSVTFSIPVATCNRKPANLQSTPFSDRNYLQLKGIQTGIICN